MPKDKIKTVQSGGKAEASNDGAFNQVGESGFDGVDMDAAGLLPVEGVEYEDALRHLGNASLVKKMIRDFWRIAPNDMEKLNGFYNGITRTATAGEEADESTIEKQDSAEEAVKYGDEAAEQYRILVHSMKNSTAMIGATTVSALAKILEYAARDRKTDVIERLHPVFAEEWLLLTEKLKKAYPAKNEEASTNIKSDKNDDSLSDDKKADKKMVLIIDDSPTMLGNIKAVLKDKYQVFLAPGGERALKFLSKKKPDVILLDYLMPDWDGVRTFEEIRKLPDALQIPIIFLTGEGDEMLENLSKLNPAGVIKKPPVVSMLIHMIEDVVRE